MKESLLKLHDLAANFFHHNLMKERSASIAREYLKKRQITSEVAKKWRLGYSPDAWDGLIQYAAGKKFSAELLETAGLALRRESGDGFYDRFRGRLMFPICDEQGRTVGFSGAHPHRRERPAEIRQFPRDADFPKGPDPVCARQGQAGDHRRRQCAIVCEGQIDTISCHEAGIENVVAPQGTALTEQHARILKRYAEEVVLMFDADAAGQNAIVRSAEPLWDAGMLIRVAVLPQGHDPDSFVKAFGAEKLKELIANAPSFFAYLLDRLCRQHDPRSERGKLQIGRQMAEWLARIPAPILLATYAQHTAKRLDISEDALRREVAKLSGNRRDRRNASEGDAVSDEAADIGAGRPRGLPEEEMLLQAMLANRQVVELVAGTLDVTWLSSSVAGETIQQVLKLHGDRLLGGPNSLLREGERGESEQLISELLLSRRTIKDPEREAPNCLMLLQRRWLEKQKHDNRRQQQSAGLAPDKMATLQKQFVDLDSKLRHIDALLRGKR